MQHFVFDLDGTLLDSHSAYFTALQQVFEVYGVVFTEKHRVEVIAMPVKMRRQFLVDNLGEQNASPALELLDKYLVELDLKADFFPGIKEILENLRAKNKKVALWTARDLHSAKRVIEHAGLSSYFSLYMSGTCVTNCKPDPEGLKRIAQAFDCETSDLTMIGDHDNDMLAAKSCGANGIRASWNSKVAAECSLSNRQFTEVESLNRWLSDTLN